MVGDIYLAKIYFTDLSQYKVRPVLVIKEIHDDCICLQLTSQMKKDRLSITKDELEHGYLKKESMVVVPKNFTLHKSILFKKLGKVKAPMMHIIMQQFCHELDCGN